MPSHGLPTVAVRVAEMATGTGHWLNHSGSSFPDSAFGSIRTRFRETSNYLDDLITNVPIKNPRKTEFVKHTAEGLIKRFRKGIANCHRLVVSTDYLVEQYRLDRRGRLRRQTDQPGPGRRPPLEDVPFNHAKSHLRLLECGVLGYPVIRADITPYRGDYPVTRVKNRYKDWLQALRAHLADRDALARRGDELRAYVEREWMLEDHLDRVERAWLP